MAAVQGLLKKYDAFETDFAVHRDRCNDICEAGNNLIRDGNHHSSSVALRCQQLQDKLDGLGSIAKRRKGRLLDNAAYLTRIDARSSLSVDSANHKGDSPSAVSFMLQPLRQSASSTNGNPRRMLSTSGVSPLLVLR